MERIFFNFLCCKSEASATEVYRSYRWWDKCGFIRV